MKGEPVLEVRDLGFSYIDGTRALDGVSLTITAGKKIAFLGPNGAGKTTLFMNFNGLMKPDEGKVYYRGEEVRYHHAALLRLRKDVGIVFQDPDTQLFSSNVRQEVSFGPLNLGLSRDEVLRRVEKAMKDTGIWELQDKPTHFLSYGQKKRVAIADILAMQPQVLICDEPTAWLDVKHSQQIMRLLDEINSQGVTVIVSTHDVDMVYSWADYIFVMKSGRLIGEGTPEEIFYNRELLAEAELTRPLLLEFYEELKNRGLVGDGLPPKDVRDLLDRIDAWGGPTRVTPGLHLV